MLPLEGLPGTDMADCALRPGPQHPVGSSTSCERKGNGRVSASSPSSVASPLGHSTGKEPYNKRQAMRKVFPFFTLRILPSLLSTHRLGCLLLEEMLYILFYKHSFSFFICEGSNFISTQNPLRRTRSQGLP